MPADKLKVVIVGSGPAGLSAAGRAAELGMSHLLIESAAVISNTVNFWYQKGKHVMDEPANLPLRSSVRFAEGTREQVLQAWEEDIQRLQIQIRFNAALKAIEGEAGDFRLHLASGEVIETEAVVLAIGNMGNVRKLGIPGEEHATVDYKLDDASLHKGQRITVIGAGDSAIEDALALKAQNRVTLINRRNGFDRAKSRNASAIQRAIQNKEIDCLFEGVPAAIEASSPTSADILVETASGSVSVASDQIIVRAGAMPQRKLLDSLSLTFPNADENAFPVIGRGYESSRSGIFIVGALAGCPLIKEAMNQGYEVIEYLAGREIDPADQPLVEAVLRDLPDYRSVSDALASIRLNVEYMNEVTTLVLREFVRESRVRLIPKGEMIESPGNYASHLGTILRGSVAISLDGNYGKKSFIWGPGDVLGLFSLTAGLPYFYFAHAKEDTVLFETPIRAASKLINSVNSIRESTERAFLRRLMLLTFVGNHVPDQIPEDLSETSFDDLIDSGTQIRLRPGQALYAEDDAAESFYIIVKGSVSLSRKIGDRDHAQHLLTSSQLVGIDEIFLDCPRLDSAVASTVTEVIQFGTDQLMHTLAKFPTIHQAILRKSRAMLLKEHERQHEQATDEVIRFVQSTGVVDGTNVLVIDESLCVRCDNCEKACAETHQGVSRLKRKVGDGFASIHVPVACRHCYEPGCMKDCPPNAIRRQPGGEVFINTETCIGCANCVGNCPFGVIQMAAPNPREPLNFFTWLLTGRGRAPGAEANHDHAPGQTVVKKALKCDLCAQQPTGPACVSSCPTGAAFRTSPERLVAILEESQLH